MATAPCPDASPQMMGEDYLGQNSRLDSMAWHGLFQELLFSKGVANPPSSSHTGRNLTNTKTTRTPVDRPPSADALESVQDFLSDDPKVRERGCSNISQIFDALGPKAEEFAMFLQDFEEGEDDEGVLTALCDGLREFFESFDAAREDRSGCPHAKAFKSVLALLLRVLLHRDRELKVAALSAFGALLAASDLNLLMRNNVLSHMLELSEDERDAFRQVAALALPLTLHHARRCAAEMHSGRQTDENEEDADLAHAVLDFKQRLRASYVRLCGDKNSAVQLSAGQQLPVFVDHIAEEVEALQQEQGMQPKRIDGPGKEDAASNDADIAELMVAVYTATQKFTLSPNESCRMQGVAAVAAMARRNATVFNALGNNFFPMLCSDSSWRVRAATCLALEDLASLSPESSMETGKSGVHRDATSAASRMPSLLFKFLTDRSPLVKIAALQQLQRTAKLLKTASFVRDSWLLELQQIGEDDSPNAASRLPGACLDAVMCILELAEGAQRRTLLELAMDLAQRGGWKLKVTLLKAVGFLRLDELAFISPIILRESFAWDEEGDDCWRIHAAIAQQLPVFLNAKLGKAQEEGWWKRCHALLLHPAWAVRQEAGVALNSILKRAREEGQGDGSLDSLIQQRLPRALQEVASCKHAFIRQELAFYLHQIWDVVPAAQMRVLAAPLLQLLMRDQAPCCRLALAKLLRSLHVNNWPTQEDFHDELETMLQHLCRDEAAGVREEASGITETILEQPRTEPVR